MRRNRSWKTILTFCGSGYSPIAPGTAGAIAALIPAFIILRFSHNPYYWLIPMIVLSTILGIIGSAILEPEWGSDPQTTVIDEVAGMWISILWIGTGLLTILLAFVLFRFFDIVKPLGIRKAEDLPSGYGVMADDILAGIYANLIVQLVLLLIPDLYKTLTLLR